MHDPGLTLKPVDAPKTVAFYLPQFHPIAENDEWWGTGFTEWTNVRRARPAFPGHYQPEVAATPFGEYSLLDPDVVAWQTEAASAHDIDAFIYYHYWFDGRRLLEQPLDIYLKTSLARPFAICWANENWTRRWDGKEREVLIAQNYSLSTPSEVFESFLPYLLDPRYLRSGDAAVLVVHRADHLPDPKHFADTWRALAAEEGVGELWLVASETHGQTPAALGFDAVAEFPPVGDSGLGTALTRLPAGTSRKFRGRMCSYERLAERYIERPDPGFVRHSGVTPRWDNTPRRMENATLFVGSSPAAYARWLNAARERERAARGARGLVFINAWNEWAEGAYLEPDDYYGLEYLEATRWGAVMDSRAPGGRTSGRLNLPGIARGAAMSVRDQFRELGQRPHG